jgi:hypothetical protein
MPNNNPKGYNQHRSANTVVKLHCDVCQREEIGVYAQVGLRCLRMQPQSKTGPLLACAGVMRQVL